MSASNGATSESELRREPHEHEPWKRKGFTTIAALNRLEEDISQLLFEKEVLLWNDR